MHYNFFNLEKKLLQKKFKLIFEFFLDIFLFLFSNFLILILTPNNIKIKSDLKIK
jgi:hypothetical protein